MLVPHCRFLSIAYHDLFDYPLTGEELKYWQIGSEQTPMHKISKIGKFYSLSGRQEIILTRSNAKKPSETKYKIAQNASRFLSVIPSIDFVGITGSLSMGAARENEDIDLLIITSVGCLWITRLLCHVLLKIKRVQVRHWKDKDIRDKLCLNMFLETKNLSFADRNEIYTAHELLQIKPLFDRDSAYRRLLISNKWVRQFFPEGYRQSLGVSTQDAGPRNTNIFLVNIIRLFEVPARIAQLFHMSTKRTREVVDNSRILFHPAAWNEYIPQIFLTRLEQLAKGEAGAVSHSQVPD